MSSTYELPSSVDAALITPLTLAQLTRFVLPVDDIGVAPVESKQLTLKVLIDKILALYAPPSVVPGVVAFTATAHGRVTGDIGKPVAITPAGGVAIWDDTSDATHPSGILVEITNANAIKFAAAGAVVSFASTLLATTDLAANGRWFYWDASAAQWVATLPTDSWFELSLIEVLTIVSGTVTAIVHEYRG